MNKTKEYGRRWYAENRERMTEYQQIYRLKTKEKQREYAKRAYKKRKLRYATDVNFRLASGLRNRLGRAIKSNFKTGSAVGDLGCTIEELKSFLESKFQPGMNWENWTRNGWHIDHIIPLCKFDLSDPDQLKKACHYTNLQPLWVEDHKMKTAREIHDN
jgi:hypothetical protein